MAGSFDPEQHPRADDGKFSTSPGSGASAKPGKPKTTGTAAGFDYDQAPKAPKPAAAKSKPKASAKTKAKVKAKIAAAKAKAKETATKIVDQAKAKAAAVKARAAASVAKRTAAIKTGKVKDKKAARAKITAARAEAKARAAAIVAHAKAKAKERSAQILARAGVVSPKTSGSRPGNTPAPAQNASRAKSEAAHSQPPSYSRQIVSGFHVSASGHASFGHNAQVAARDHARAEIAKHGIVPREPHAAGKNTLQVEELGGSTAMFIPDTHAVVMTPANAAALAAYHASQPKELGEQAMAGNRQALDKIKSQHALLHEQLHASGPDARYEGAGVFAEEMVTEMAARAVTAQAHGIQQTILAPGGAYDWVMDPAVHNLATASRKSFGEAHEALASAALSFKRGDLTPGRHFTDQLNGETIIHVVTKEAMRTLGQHDPAVHRQAYDSFMKIGNEL